jgi:hypothetical protein
MLATELQTRNPVEARERLRRAADALAEMGEAKRLPNDWLERMDRYRDALQDLLRVEGLLRPTR